MFERRWALTLLERALSRLQAEWASAGKGAVFEQLREFVTGEQGPVSRADAGAALGLSLSATKSTILRLRWRYHELVRDAVAWTVTDPAQVEGELRDLLEAFARDR
ncbi:MAG: hypothetical protein FJ387_10230 [Verrucomicrobia bacterium]|nr:hypothetical protein [Verrucomicrobiota bacterium]